MRTRGESDFNGATMVNISATIASEAGTGRAVGVSRPRKSFDDFGAGTPQRQDRSRPSDSLSWGDRSSPWWTLKSGISRGVPHFIAPAHHITPSA